MSLNSSAPSQSGIIDGENPSAYSAKDPLPLFIIQVSLILIISRLLHFPLARLQQPRVISEVLSGIILGPSVMGRIPGFQLAIFPAASIPNLTLVANLGLVLYLFLIGLEVDLTFLMSHWRVALSVAAGGLIVPYAGGCALAVGLYHQYKDDPGVINTSFSVYSLFIGVALAITAFPVLCRILSELQLLDSEVGIAVLAAGVANDVVGWILLALCVAIVNAGNGLSALYVFLVGLGFMFFLLIGVRPALYWALRRTGSLESGPSQGLIGVILLITLASAFFTDVIGIHAIFGGFLAGLIIPRQHGFAIRVTEKLEDLIGALLLPLYFTLSGLSTNLGLLNSGTTWGYVVAVTVTAFGTKILGSAVAARLNGLVWRESFAVGALMSCKGLVELIVLNIGLQARILSQTTFTIFVVMALVTTFATTPLATNLYSLSYRLKLNAWKRGEINWDTGEMIQGHDDASTSDTAVRSDNRISRLLVYVRLDSMPSTLALVSLFGHKAQQQVTTTTTSALDEKIGKSTVKTVAIDRIVARPVRAHGIRLLELTDRVSSVMAVAHADEYSHHDPVVNTFRAVGMLHNVTMSGEAAMMPEELFVEALVERSSQVVPGLMIIPWSETGNIMEAQIVSTSTSAHKLSSSYANFVRSIFESTASDTAVFIASGFGRPSVGGDTAGTIGTADAIAQLTSSPFSWDESTRPRLSRALSTPTVRSNLFQEYPAPALATQSHHIFMAFFGGSDDRLALQLVLQLCEHDDVQATVVHFWPSSSTAEASDGDYFAAALVNTIPDVAARVRSETVAAKNPGRAAIERACQEVGSVQRQTLGDILVVGRRSAAGQLPEVAVPVGPEVQACLGLFASGLIGADVKASLLVVQSKGD